MTCAITDREEAGRRLAPLLEHLRGRDVVVLGLPRGGVPVAAQVAEWLGAPLDVVVVRKLGVPWQPELAMGAVGEGGVMVVDEHVLRSARLSRGDLEEVATRERAELERRTARFRGDRPRVPVAGRTAVVVDDGVATGSTARAACQVVRALGATHVVLAVPVAPAGWEGRLAGAADELVAVRTPRFLGSIGEFYDDFRQTSDEEVLACLSGVAPPSHVTMAVPADGAGLVGDLVLPAGARGLVVFAHGTGSSRHSPRNRAVARVLQEARLGTVLLDLLDPTEQDGHATPVDVELLAARLGLVVRHLTDLPTTAGLPIGLYGASTGAAVALLTAAEPGSPVAAVVSRGGRPDLAALRLPAVRVPTLLVVGQDDPVVLDLNERALRMLRCEARLVVVPGAGHLFEEPGTLDVVAEAARDWFVEHLRARRHRDGGPERLRA
ncbi:phosphoribosyltransferase family protein [Actinotalea sp. Marseille-Q4924]|uniref:phosphoribosyltransferase family protein n=1 Tax=Actinotalea sp. Marseille-Q4924 TaxID=2866571 RepID=UPI001CE3EDDD|nr:phosphoribosyltransferase family protein [Actinotalea sp. Marseille-Q4924]